LIRVLSEVKMADIQSDDRVGPAGPWGAHVGTQVKICGITNLADAQASVDAGADLLGFNFYRKSPRFIEPARAREIIDTLPDTVLSVGVFVNEPSPDAVVEIAVTAGIGVVQLHGDEDTDYCAALSAWPVIKALRVGPDFDPSAVARFQTAAILLDGFAIQAYGGTGKAFDWNVAKQLPDSRVALFLAGGLGVDNVAEAVRQIKPFAVDACSRLESTPGRKDPALIASFIAAVRSVGS
jgi:phosphoribosylanthranilate isomerase